jgi:hypothetical protein
LGTKLPITSIGFPITQAAVCVNHYVIISITGTFRRWIISLISVGLKIGN